MTFPTDTYTPYGYLQSPDHLARSWDDATGGMIRTSEQFLGMGWAYVHPRRAVFLCAAMEIGTNRFTRAPIGRRAISMHRIIRAN